MKFYKLVICDIDGTLVDNQKHISVENKHAIEHFKNQGGRFSIATGRIEKSVAHFCDELAIDIPVILYNGAKIIHPVSGEVLLEHCLSTAEVKHAVSLLLDLSLDPIFYSGGEGYVFKITPAIETYQTGDGLQCIPINDISKLSNMKINKILIIGDSQLFDSFREKFQKGPGCLANLVQSEFNFLEILPEGVNKGTALVELAKYLKINMDDIICFGDNPNDIEMIQIAGMGVAMGNAHKDLKKQADLIAPLNTESGVGAIIREMIKYDITMVGHISKDIMIYEDDKQYFTGGPVIYSSIAAARSGKIIQVLTRASIEDDSSLDIMRKEGIFVTRQDSKVTTSIENVYFTSDKERRKVTLLSRADSFSVEEFPETNSRIYHLAGLFRGEIPDEFIPFFAAKGKVGVDAQGLLRCSENGNLLFRNWDAAEKLMPYIYYLKTDAAEAEIMTGFSDREKAAQKLAALGAREVMITHNNEVLVFTEGHFYRAPYNPSNLSGRTGRGDTTFAAYMAKRLDATPYESVFYAAALCSIKMESPGAFHFSTVEVYNRMKEIGFRKETVDL